MKKSTILIAMLAVVGALTIGKMTASAAFAQEPAKSLLAKHEADAKGQTAKNEEKDEHDGEEEDDLLTAPIGMSRALAIAGQQVKGYANKAELESEKGKLTWSINVVSLDGKQSAEVEVDATTGALIKTKIEDGEEKDGPEPVTAETKEGPEGDGDGETNDGPAGEVRG